MEQAQTRQVTISLIPLFGMGWFIPRLPTFMRANPQTEINVVYANHRNYLSDASDMSIRFGNGQWAGYQSEKADLRPDGAGVQPRVFAYSRSYRYARTAAANAAAARRGALDLAAMVYAAGGEASRAPQWTDV